MARARTAPTILPQAAPGDRLDELLGLWEQTRVVVIAETIDRITDETLASWRPPAPRSREAFQTEWVRALADDVGRGWAVRVLGERLPGKTTTNQAAALARRLTALRAYGADPRAALAAAELLIGRSELARSSVVPVACELLLAEALDDRVRFVLERAVGADPALDEILGRLLARPHEGRALTRREAERFAVATQPNTSSSANVDALVAQVLAQPDADEPRLVLADALQAQGDPRGEFIALQLAAPTPERLRRIDQLVHAAGADWLGELRALAYRVQYQRGFVARLELVKTWDDAAALRTHPLLATVLDLVPGDAKGERYAELVTSPAMRSLRSIEVYDVQTIAALEQTAAPLVHVACPRLKRGSGNYALGLANRVLPACAQIETLRSLGIAVAGFPALVASKLLDRLRSVTIGDNNLGAVLALYSQLPEDLDLVAKRWAGLEECVSLRVAWLGELRIARNRDDRVATTWGEWPIYAVLEHFAALPPLDKLVVAGATPEQAAQLQKAAKRRRLRLELEPAPVRTGYVTIKP